MLTNRMAVHRRARRRHGLAAVLWGVACLACFQGGYVLLGYWRPQLHDPEFGGKLVRLKARLAEQTSPGPLMVALGSSHVGMGLRPGLLDSTRPDAPLVFNFAINAGTPMVSLVCLR